MPHCLTSRDRQRLEGVDKRLVAVIERAAEMSPIPFTILEGRRSETRQRQLVAAGASQTLKSKHIIGKAVDLAPMVDGRVSWDWPLYHALAPHIKKAAAEMQVAIKWGGDWKSFKDGPHWELMV